MIQWRREGELIKPGLNVYHPSEKHSWGGALRIGKRVWRVRYSRIAHRWFIGTYTISGIPVHQRIKDHYDL